MGGRRTIDIEGLAGSRFGKLVILKFLRRDAKSQIYVRCLCDCGKEIETQYGKLKIGATLSCGCTRNVKYPIVDGSKECGVCHQWFPVEEFLRKGCSINNKCKACTKKMANIRYHRNKGAKGIRDKSPYDKELLGRRFGKLLVTSFVKSGPNGQSFFSCKCDCGADCVVRRNNLVRGMTSSCGCSPTGRPAPAHGTAVNRLFRSYAASAKKRNILFDLTIDYFMALTSSDCAYCGASPAKRTTDSRGNNGYAHNGIDRIDNTMGYVEGNVTPCCTTCNYAKRQMTVLEFIGWANSLYLHLVEKEFYANP